MNNKRLPWMKFACADWMRDMGLRDCSFAARGFWMDLICLMDASEQYGYLVKAGRPVTVKEIAKLLSCDQRSAERHLVELERNNIFSRDDRGVIFCRRMVRDAAKSVRDEANGSKGGNPALRAKSATDSRGSPIDSRGSPTDARDPRTSVQDIVNEINNMSQNGVNPTLNPDKDSDKDKEKKLASLAAREAKSVPHPAISAGQSLLIPEPIDVDDGFEAWWALYPLKVGKKGAAKAYRAAIKNGVTPFCLMNGLLKHLPGFETERSHMRFNPHASTWINGERWNDEVRQPSKRTSRLSWLHGQHLFDGSMDDFQNDDAPFLDMNAEEIEQ